MQFMPVPRIAALFSSVRISAMGVVLAALFPLNALAVAPVLITSGGSFVIRTMAYRPYWLVEYRNALEDRSDVAINYVVQPVASDYVLGLRSSFDDTLSIGAGVDMELPRGWQLALQVRHEQAGSNRAESYGLRLSWGSAGAMMPSSGMEDPLRDPTQAARAAGNMQAWLQP